MGTLPERRRTKENMLYTRKIKNNKKKVQTTKKCKQQQKKIDRSYFHTLQALNITHTYDVAHVALIIQLPHIEMVQNTLTLGEARSCSLTCGF